MEYDLKERLIDFGVRILKLANRLPNTVTGRHINGQIIRSGTSPAPNYGEAQSAESRADFIHKIKIALKELRETEVWLIFIKKAELVNDIQELDKLIAESNELISIFVKSAQTAKRNMSR